MGRRKQRHEPHVRLYQHELRCEAYRSLSCEARALLVEFRALYNGTENRVHMSIREIRRRLNGIGQLKAERARDELIDRGFIRLMRQGSFSRKRPHASVYALTNYELREGDLRAPKDFMRWPQKNTVLIPSTAGIDSEYRGDKPNGKKHPRGTDSEYRRGHTKHPHGTDSEYTDKLPPEGAVIDAPSWLIEHGGWPCKNGQILNACCIVCGVWTTSDGYEFDSGRHSCDKVSKAKYQERLRPTVERRAAA